MCWARNITGAWSCGICIFRTRGWRRRIRGSIRCRCGWEWEGFGRSRDKGSSRTEGKSPTSRKRREKWGGCSSALLYYDFGGYVVGAYGAGNVGVLLPGNGCYREHDTMAAVYSIARLGNHGVGGGPSRHSISVGVLATGDCVGGSGAAVGKRDGSDSRAD